MRVLKELMAKAVMWKVCRLTRQRSTIFKANGLQGLRKQDALIRQGIDIAAKLRA